MTGKETCNELREIRKTIAAANGIPFETVDCPHTGDCPGTCPKCDGELRFLERALKKKEKKGETVRVPSLPLSFAGAAAPADDAPYPLGGDVPAPEVPLQTAGVPARWTGKAEHGFSRFLFYLVQWTWGLPVNLIGLIVYLILYKKCRHEKFHNAYITYLPWKHGGLSTGLFIFMADGKSADWTYNTRIHEYGHTIQCLLLGPLYWLVIGLPSAVWCNCFEGYRRKHNVSYYKLYCESWANRWGEKWSCEKRNEVR